MKEMYYVRPRAYLKAFKAKGLMVKAVYGQADLSSKMHAAILRADCAYKDKTVARLAKALGVPFCKLATKEKPRRFPSEAGRQQARQGTLKLETATTAKEETAATTPSPLDNWKEAEKVEDYTILTPETRRKLNNKNATIVIKVQERFKELAIARQKDLGLKNLTTYITHVIARDLGVRIV